MAAAAIAMAVAVLTRSAWAGLALTRAVMAVTLARAKMAAVAGSGTKIEGVQIGANVL